MRLTEERRKNGPLEYPIVQRVFKHGKCFKVPPRRVTIDSGISNSHLNGMAVHDGAKVNADGLEEGDSNFEGGVPEDRRDDASHKL
jgi:hypothetical protein